jgi:hypothetical protein
MSSVMDGGDYWETHFLDAELAEFRSSIDTDPLEACFCFTKGSEPIQACTRVILLLVLPVILEVLGGQTDPDTP